ncbi:hypothetical protein F3Y22_tig00111769pilonHSYRG00601 [Hibiscus syriacus]|uniref:Uncharacterized protein n=1 Tax=Hibiscus syriacus TaxID=106335 RepID=A0A6A2Y1P6_HIBSY|nr:hypothetical protein F3Y22_tig00111769pilonHSYRG00601 [Hibiscus syriacus]
MTIHNNSYEIVRRLASTNAVVLFSTSGLGVFPVTIDLGHHVAGPDIQAALFQLAGGRQQPILAVFVGGI